MNILSIILPLVLVASLGFTCAKSQWLSRAQIDALSKFTFYLSIPAFLFYQMANADLSGQVTPQFFAAFYLPVLCCFGLAMLANYLFNKERASPDDMGSSAVFALGASYSNTVIVGLPILLVAVGEQAIGITFLIITFHSMLLFGLTTAIAAKGTNKFSYVSFIKQNLKNPLVLSITLGLVVNLLGIELPIMIQETLTMLGKPAITIALFILGASLSYYRLAKRINFTLLACFHKLLLLPFLVFISAEYLFNLPATTVAVLVVLSASPTGVNAYLIAQAQQQNQQVVAGTVVLTTLLCTLTIPLWLILVL